MQKQTWRKTYRHLDQSDRDRMEALLVAGHKQVEIARILKVDKGTVSREMKRRLRIGQYDASAAQMKANVKRSNSKYQGMKIEKLPLVRDYLINQLKDHRSPDEIAGYLKRMKMEPRIGTNAIYKWLYSSYGNAYAKYLCTKRHLRKPQKPEAIKRVMIPNAVSIDERFQGATNKTRYRHFDGDTLVSPKKSGSTASIAVAVERKINFIVGTKIPNLKPAEMTSAVNRIQDRVHMKSVTLDRGIENRSHASWGVPAFFADPHSPWQKPHVENNIGLLRRWFIPKKTNLAGVSEEQLQTYISILNHKYRKSLGYKSAYEVALEHGIIEKDFNTTRVALH
jgi:IS30 family transposase